MTRLLAFIIFAVGLSAQTRAVPSQIRDWRQVSSRVIAPDQPGRGLLDLRQLKIDEGFVQSWKKIQYNYDWLEVAVVGTQPNPILIHPPETARGNYKFWFKRKHP